MEPTPHLKSPYWKSTQKIANYAIAGQDTQSGFHNLNAPNNITLTLPKAIVGGAALQYKFLVATAKTITISPKLATDTIRGFPVGSSITLTGIGSGLHLECWIPGFWEIVTETTIIGGQFTNPTAAEIAANVTPIYSGYLEGDFRRYGADATGATFSDTAINNAIAVAHKMTQPTLIVNGQFKVVSMNLSNRFGGVDAPDFNNRGLRMIGVGVQSSTITCISAVNNVGVGIDASGMAYWHWSDIRFNFGAPGQNTPLVGLLLGKTSAGGSVFAGIGKFECCQFIGFGTTYNVFDQSAEQIDFNNCLNIIATGTGTPYWFSRANTPGITSPNTTLSVPGDSMTTISFSGAQSTIRGQGAQLVFLDIGSTTGFGAFDFGNSYTPLQGATTVVLRDNGGVGSTITGLHAANLDVEFNGGAGTNQVMVLGSQLCNDLQFKGSSAYTNPATQLSTLFVFGNPLKDSHIIWTGNAVPGFSQPASLISGTQAFGCIFQTTGLVSSVVFSGGGQLIVMASDFIQSTMGATTLTQPLTTAPGVADATAYTLAILKGGVRTSSNTDGGIRRITTANISTAATIYTGLTFGELITVTGVSGSAIFADLLMASVNGVVTISSNTQQGAPAARTYAVTAGALTLAMTTGTYNIVAQSLLTGAQV